MNDQTSRGLRQLPHAAKRDFHGQCLLRVIVCDSEETADKDWIAGMNAASRCRDRDGPAFVEIISSHVRRVLFRGHETISDDALLTGWEFHQ